MVGDQVTIADIACPSCNTTTQTWNGTYVVTAIPSSTTFQFTTSIASLPAATAGTGTAAANINACGLVDQGAALIPNDGGKVLIAGGDTITFLGQSSNLSFLFDPASQTFTRTTGSLTTPRELFPLIAMDPSVVTGALSGQVVAFGGIDANSAVACTVATKPTVATTTNTAEVFDPSSQTWSAAANTMGVKRATIATLIETGGLAGEVILPGGVDVEAGTFPSTCAAITALKQTALKQTDLYAPDTGTGGTFSATGLLNQAREGQAQGILGAGTDSTDLLVIGGACTGTPPSLKSWVIGTAGASAATACNTAGATSDYSELYSQGPGTWAVGPTFASGATPVNGAATVVLP